MTAYFPQKKHKGISSCTASPNGNRPDWWNATEKRPTCHGARSNRPKRLERETARRRALSSRLTANGSSSSSTIRNQRLHFSSLVSTLQAGTTCPSPPIGSSTGLTGRYIPISSTLSRATPRTPRRPTRPAAMSDHSRFPRIGPDAMSFSISTRLTPYSTRG